MKKSTKGALAAGAAAVLLLGGAGTLAYWTDDASVNGGSVSSGDLSLTAGACDPTWVYAPGNAQAGVAVTDIVPGDAITKSCTFTIGAEGDNLTAAPDVPDTISYTTTPAQGPGSTLSLDVDATFELDGAPFTDASVITEDNDGDVLTADVVVTFPFGTATTVNANDTQDLDVAFADLTVTLTQTEA